MPQILKSKSLIIFFIYLTVIYLAVCDFFLPFKYESSEWLPIFSGYLDLDYLYSNNILMGILGMLFISLIPISIYLISIKLSNVSIELQYIIPLSLLICFVSPNGFYFSSIYIVSLARVLYPERFLWCIDATGDEGGSECHGHSIS